MKCIFQGPTIAATVRWHRRRSRARHSTRRRPRMAQGWFFTPGDSSFHTWTGWLVGGLEHGFYDFPILSIYWECHHPNWLSYFSEGLKPPTRWCYQSDPKLVKTAACMKWVEKVGLGKTCCQRRGQPPCASLRMAIAAGSYHPRQNRGALDPDRWWLPGGWGRTQVALLVAQ